MPEFVRVRDSETGHEYSVVDSVPLAETQTIIDKPAVSPDGTPLPPKHNLITPKPLSGKSGVGDSAAASAGQKATSDKEAS